MVLDIYERICLLVYPSKLFILQISGAGSLEIWNFTMVFPYRVAPFKKRNKSKNAN